MSTKVRVAALPACDLCGDAAHYDGRTKSGPWANMCQSCFSLHGVGLGTGRGQELVLADDKPQTTGYEAWMRAVDRYLLQRIGLTSMDLSDFNSRDCYDSGMSPEEAAEECLSEQDGIDWEL